MYVRYVPPAILFAVFTFELAKNTSTNRALSWALKSLSPVLTRWWNFWFWNNKNSLQNVFASACERECKFPHFNSSWEYISVSFTSSLSLSMDMRLFIWCFCLLQTLELSKAWDFTKLGISNASIVHHISVYYARAFICLTHPSNHNRPLQPQSTPTLVEASWPENMIGVRPVIFPSEDYFIRREGKCKGILQAAVSGDMELFGMSISSLWWFCYKSTES